MAAITFASKLKEDGSLTIPTEAAERLGLRSGDEVQVRVEAAHTNTSSRESDQNELQAKFDQFFEGLEGLTFDKPSKFPEGDPAETAFVSAMDEKYSKLGFKP